MKVGLLGCVNNVSQHIDKIKVWSKSFGEVSKGSINLVLVNPQPHEISLLKDMGITTFPYYTKGTETINNMRLQFQWQTLDELDLDYVLVTDVFDVMFQDNPFIKIWGNDIIVGTEGITHNEEPWNMSVLQQSYPDKVEKLRHELIVCSGVIGGRKDKIIKLLKDMDKLTMGKGGHDIRDQAALNIILYQPLSFKSWENKSYNIKVLSPKDGWVLHCAVGGPTQFYEAWGFKNKMKERFGEARNEGGIIVNGDWQIFDIVHQFNRIEEWNKELTTRYI
tara:strand:- start:452 stop:1285 length:834 start_codon:yes stop_codon:yes gene_type:complete